ncbi:hypothetical protein [Thiolapillus sp.]
MLARFLKIWLIVSILGYGMALAADVHGELTVDSEIQLTDSNTDSPDSTTDDTGCHHCAHGISHLLGLSYAGGIAVAATRGMSPQGYSLTWSSFSPPSLLRPPIHA